MKTNYKIITALLAVLVYFSSCKRDDYFVGGSLHNSKVNLSTYDFLKNNNRALFDTLLLLVDKAGIKDKINQPGITFFAPTDYAIQRYCEVRTKAVQRVDPNKKWTVDSIIKYELPRFADSLNVHILPKKVSYNEVTEEGKLFETNKAGAQCIVSYSTTNDVALGYNPASTVLPKVMLFVYLYEPIVEPFVLTNDNAAITLVQTSGIETTTGIVHVLANTQPMFFAR